MHVWAANTEAEIDIAIRIHLNALCSLEILHLASIVWAIMQCSL